MERKFQSAVRESTRRSIEDIGHADIIVGIPCYFSQSTVEKVMLQAAEGLNRYFPEKRSVIIISDGGSTDDTREVASMAEIHYPSVSKITSIYRGVPGKGSAIREVLEIGVFLNAGTVIFVDSDLRSITPEWIRNLAEPVIAGSDFVTPDYNRYKFDGTITNTIVYNLTRALFGADIRQPIGGDFAVSKKLAAFYLSKDVWDTDVARFGIDIWMTVNAIAGRFKLCQTRLGAKIHGEKDPSCDLSSMFRQVVGTIFSMLEEYEDFWKNNHGSTAVPVTGEFVGMEAPAFKINEKALIEYFKTGFTNFSGVWKKILERSDYDELVSLSCADNDQVLLKDETWVRIVYSYACAFHLSRLQRFKLLDTMIPLYYCRVASLIKQLKYKDHDEAEKFFDSQAVLFRSMKGFLMNKWDDAKKRRGYIR
ncbi:MAG TPA: glycosyltransferase [bacterium]|nr:glycosyltransferase [bacterium]